MSDHVPVETPLADGWVARWTHPGRLDVVRGEQTFTISGPPDVAQRELVARAARLLRSLGLVDRPLGGIPVDDALPTDPGEGFRPRRTRPEGWLAAAIADGSVRDPDGPDPGHPDLPPDAVVFAVPVGRLAAAGLAPDAAKE